MTENTDGLTPKQFHQHAGVGDWRVMAWGPEACFLAGSLGAAAALVPEIVEAAADLGLKPDIDVRPEAVLVRLPYRDTFSIPADAPQFAQRVSAAARSLGLATAPHLVQSVNIAVAQHAEVDVRPFWAATLGYDFEGDTDALDPFRRGPALSFMPVIPVPGRGRTHIDVSVPADQAEARVAAALAAGGRLADDSNAPMWWTVASPDNHGIDIAAWTDTYGDDSGT